MITTEPSSISTPAVFLTNWKDIMAVWMASRLSQKDTPRAPRLGELHYLGGPAKTWSVNQIVDYTGFFRDESAGIKYTSGASLDAEAWFESDDATAGTLTTSYLAGAGAAEGPRLRISRSYVAVPDQPLLVVRYTLTNPTADDITYSVLDLVHLNNIGGTDPGALVHAWFDGPRNALFADMTASGQFFVVLGAFQPASGYQVGDDSNQAPQHPTASAFFSFDHDGTLRNNAELRASDVDLAFQQNVTVAAGQSGSFYFYLTVCGDLKAACAAADAARARPGSAWFDRTAQAYVDWLWNEGRGKRTTFDDAGLNMAFDRALIMIKNAQNPALGTIAATTNPIAYEHKAWVRDAAITAIALDASGHFQEANLYWRWMASVQEGDGTWKTTYSVWDGNHRSFVEPEYDSVGAFLYGVYRHHEATGDSALLHDLAPILRRSADWILTTLAANGFGPADFSIWEEGERGLGHHAFTQAWYVAGLYAAQRLAEIRGDTAASDWYAGGPASILAAVQRPSNWRLAGLWNPAGYYNRAVNLDDSALPLEDSSSNILFALGVVDHESCRAERHMETIVRRLTHDRCGIARYRGDDYYHTSHHSPAGDEAHGLDPSWPQMSMWVAAYEILRGRRADALSRMQWFVSTLGRGYMPHGEAISRVTGGPVLSSMSAPLTSASYLLVALLHQGRYDLRITPPIHNAGAFKAITVAEGVPCDPAQWHDVPYFLGPRPEVGDASPITAIKRVYLANDGTKLYLRIDNLAGSFPASGAAPELALRVYCGDFAGDGVPATVSGLDLQTLARPASFAVESRRDSNDLRRYGVNKGRWCFDEVIDTVIAPWWSPALGRVEAVIPISALASATPLLGDAWAALTIELVRHDPARDTWAGDARVLLHYRLTSGAQPWIYGNIEQ